VACFFYYKFVSESYRNFFYFSFVFYLTPACCRFFTFQVVNRSKNQSFFKAFISHTTPNKMLKENKITLEINCAETRRRKFFKYQSIIMDTKVAAKICHVRMTPLIP
jgi:hypothetical protein